MNDTLQTAYGYFKRGEKQEAAKLLAALVIKEPKNANAWFGLAVCIDDKEKKIFCFEKVLSIEPNHTKAKDMLEKLSPKTEKKECPYCAETVPDGAKWCRNCGRNLRETISVEEESSEAYLPEVEPEEPRVQQPADPSGNGITERPWVKSTIIGAVLIIGLIGISAAMIFVFYRMRPLPIPTPEVRVFAPNPTKTSRPLAATPNPSSITPPYFEDFSDGPGIWHVRNDEEVMFAVSDGEYVIQPKNPGGSWWTSPRAQLDNIRLEFTTNFRYTFPMEDGGFRVNFRCKDIDEELCYIMTISENGYLFVHRDAETLVEHKLSQHINLYDHPNEWVINMDGSEFEIYSNGELLTTFSDIKYQSGDFGFGVFNSTNDRWGFNGVAFDNIRVSSLE